MASGCGQWMWSVDVVSGCDQWMSSVDVVSGCGQWVWSVGVVSGWWIYFLPHNEVFLLLCLPSLHSLIPTSCTTFVLKNILFF